jgi:hypothetical protein
MAIDRLMGNGLKQVASFVSSGTFTVPEGVNQLYVSVMGAAGARSGGDNSEGGAGLQVAGYVSVVPGGTYPVIIGARGTRGQQGLRYTPQIDATTGGDTTFDAALRATSGGIGSGTNGTTFAETSVLSLAPAGATARVTNTASGGINNSGAGSYTYNNGNGMVWIYA